jgi:hypothetical protein
MNSRHILTVAAFLGGLLAASCLVAADDSYEQSISDKVLVTDGHMRHDVGSLQNHVTNWGLIGSRPSVPTPFNLAPSARWGGVDYLWAAGVWFGGTVLGQPLVSTGQYASEFTASQAPGDTIFAATRGAVGGTRYPWPGADDDGDGAEDEDPLDGLDNDLDGLVDEDFAAVGDQHFRCTMADNHPEIINIYPDHTPLNLEIVQQSFQWANPIGANFIGYEYRVTNAGVTDIDGFHCGIFADFDIGQPENDHAGSVFRSGNGMVRSPWGDFVPMFTGYMYDGAPAGAAPGWVGFVMCGLETDAAAGPPANPLEMHSHQIFSGNAPFEQGGDPTNDAERYELLQQDHWDTDSLPGRESDYRTLMSTPAVAVLAPGETVVFRMALVIGEGLEDMLGNAAAAVTTAYGQSFDRDGDPGNGEEFHVPWLMPDEAPVPAVTGHIQARRAPGVLSLRFDVRHTQGGLTEITRRESTGVPFRAWSVEQESGFITDDDAVGWPRTYDLRLKFSAGSDLVLDTVEVPAPAILPLNLAVSPNPFNPRLTIEYSLSVQGSARLEILDLRGHVVRVLFDTHLPAGTDRFVWNGLDSQGRAAASGVYLVRLVTDQGFTQQQVTLLR